MLIYSAALQAQETVSATGGDATGTGGSASYSVGQVAYTTMTGANGTVASGVQQAYEISVLTGTSVVDISVQMSTYPNPTKGKLNLDVGNHSGEALSYQVFDMQGMLLQTQQITADNTSIDLQQFVSNTYLLKVVSNDKAIKTFRIIKN